MTTLQVVTLVIAGWGALLGTYGAVVSTQNLLLQRRRDRQSVVVSCHFGYLDRRADDADSEHEHVPVITIEAKNIGLRPVEIRRAGFIRPNGESVHLPTYLIEPAPPPHSLADGARECGGGAGSMR